MLKFQSVVVVSLVHLRPLDADECLFAMCYRPLGQPVQVGKSCCNDQANALGRGGRVIAADCADYTVVPVNAQFLSVQTDYLGDH
ncbi:hypothetical protein D9M72_187600 [compost metagenome]